MDWTPQIAAAPGPRYAAIVRALSGDIEAGLLGAGDRLPTHRALAAKLGVSLGTVTRAYNEARSHGLVEGEVGRGTFVRDQAPVDTRWALKAAPDRSIVDLSLLFSPSIEGTPAEAPLRRGLGRIVDALELDEVFSYQDHAGAPAHRRAGAEWIGRTDFHVEPSDTLVCASGQHAMTCAVSMLARPGDVVMTETLTAPGFKDLASWMQLRLHGLASDEQGLIPTAFEAACRLGVSRVLYTMPVLHNPTTVTMPPDRREEIAGIATRYGVAVIEDGVLGLLPGDGIVPLAAFAPETSYYITSLSKTIAPGLRVGFIRPPRGARPQIEDAIRATMWMASPLLAEIASTWIADGTAEAVLEARRKEARARQSIAADVLRDFSFLADPGGYHLWLSELGAWQVDTLVRAAHTAGVAITAADVFVAGGGHAPPRVRVCLGAATDRARLTRGLEILRGLLVSEPAFASDQVLSRG